MTFRRIARLVGAAILTASAILLSVPVPFASAQPCPDVDVAFARGTGEPPGVGGIGQAFVDALRGRKLRPSQSMCIRSTTPRAAISDPGSSSPEP